MLYWAQVNDEFAKNWQNFEKIQKKNCCNILKFVGPRGKLSSVSQLNNTAVLLNHEIRSNLKSMSLQENVHDAYLQQSHTKYKHTLNI